MAVFLKLMKFFLFLTRVGFILNLIFVVCIVLRFIPTVAELFPQSLVSILVIGGWVLSFIVNIILSILWLLLLQRGNAEFKLPILVIFNLLILVFQLLYFFIL